MAANRDPYKKNYQQLMMTIWPDKLDEDYEPPVDLPEKARRMAWQYEVAPETGRIHIQVRLTDLTHAWLAVMSRPLLDIGAGAR